MLHQLSLLPAVVTCLLTTGCLWLPIPNRSTEEYGVKARVVDADTGLPIYAATICDKYKPSPCTQTDRLGNFQMPPRFQWHAGYCFFAVNTSIPNVVRPVRYLTVRAEGYQPQSFDLEDFSANEYRIIVHDPDATLSNGAWVGEGHFEVVDAKVDGSWLEASRIPLHRIRLPQGRPATQDSSWLQ